MRLAYFSPLNPQPSGISDYSEELLPYLQAAGAEIDLFVEGFAPSSRETLARFKVFDYVADPSSLAHLGRYDAVVYHIGNDHRYHSGINDVMRRYPGVAVFHDFALHDFFLGLARERGDAKIYLDEVAAEHGERTRAEAEEALARGAEPPIAARPTAYPLNCRLARGAEGVIVHSNWSRERIERIAPGVPVTKINMPVKPPAVAHDRATVAHAGRIELATFGLITPGKGIAHALRALGALRGDYDFHYTLVGAPNAYFDIETQIRAHSLSDRVTVTGHLPLAEFERRMGETDIALNIRERSVGETSASLCRLMAAGVPAIVADAGWYAELPDDCVVKIELDEYCDALLVAYLRRLMEDAPLRAALGANARRHVLAGHDIERSAESYLSFIREVVAGRARRFFVAGVSSELARLGLDADRDEALLRSVAAELDALAPAPNGSEAPAPNSVAVATAASSVGGHEGAATSRPRARELFEDVERAPEGEDIEGRAVAGRLQKVEGIDYKRAAIEYTRKLDDERRHYLYTKPFYNLANKPPKHTGDGMDEETHRHFCDFANMAVALALPAGRRILDVGCGSGWLAEFFARLGYDVTGIDISPDLIEIARERTARVPYDVDHETPLRCRFLVHDAEGGPLDEKFDAVVCYDSLHHFEDERAVMRNLSAMVETGGMLFVLEGDRPDEGSDTEEELIDVMRRYETLESPFGRVYLRELLVEHGFLIVGDFVSVGGLFERETVEGNRVEIETTAVNYLLCKKVVEGVQSAAHVKDSSHPGTLLARLAIEGSRPESFAPGESVRLALAVENVGESVWLTGPARRRGAVMLGIRLLDSTGEILKERHGEPPLPRALAPGEGVTLPLRLRAPEEPGVYMLKIDLVAQHVRWFEQGGSEPLVLPFSIR